jgi:sugar phosphate isomerase/epimerase
LHAKDLLYRNNLTFHIDEVVWGQGIIDLRTFLKRAHALHPDVPVGLEHMPDEAYAPSIALIRSVGQELSISL